MYTGIEIRLRFIFQLCPMLGLSNLQHKNAPNDMRVHKQKIIQLDSTTKHFIMTSVNSLRVMKILTMKFDL